MKKNNSGSHFWVSQKILVVVFLSLFFYICGVMSVTLFSNRKLEETVNKKFEGAFNEVFINIGNIFNDFETIVNENTRKTSGLFSLEKIWGEFLKGHQKYLDMTEFLIQ